MSEHNWPGKLTRIEAIGILDRISDREDPAWEWSVEDFYHEESDTFPTIYEVLAAIGVTKDEYKEASGAQNVNWSDVWLDSAMESQNNMDKLEAEVARLQEKVTDLSDEAYEYSEQAETLLRENLRLTTLLDEGQALALDADDPETMYRLQRDLARWAGRVNIELYEQAEKSREAGND